MAHKNFTNFSKTDFLETIDFTLSSSYCFCNNFYKQIFGLPMRSPISPATTNLVVEDLENSILNKFNFKVLFYFRYVDDIHICVLQRLK